MDFIQLQEQKKTLERAVVEYAFTNPTVPQWQIAKHFKISQATVSDMCRKAGLTRKRGAASEAQKALRKQRKEQAEIAGVK
jgi:transposase